MSEASHLGRSEANVRECIWCNEDVPERKDGRLAVHRWEVGWDRDRDKPIMGRCSGSETSRADAEDAWGDAIAW